MPVSHQMIDILFILSVMIIWSMIIYQLFFTFAGYLYRRSSAREAERLSSEEIEYPSVSVLIPARNEGKVIARTLQSILNMDYPRRQLEVVVINDGSTDGTKEIVEQVASQDPRVKLVNLPVQARGRGKSYALNIALQTAQHPYIAVYDADNRPEPSALKHLMAQLVANPRLGAVIGKFRTVNKAKNWLTRFINIETLSFQWILQAGRYKTFQIAILPGTNFIIKKEVVEDCGGWDEEAITEDSELSVRVYQLGYTIKFVPYAVTWEQEPEKWKTWVRQRTRWVRGNNYVVTKFFRQAFRFRSRFLAFELMYLFLLYYLFLAAIVLSHTLFMLSASGVVALQVPGPYTAVWISAYILFFMEIAVVLTYERENSPLNLGLMALMYFTYCQAWIYVVFRGLFLDLIRREQRIWDKTERFDV